MSAYDKQIFFAFLLGALSAFTAGAFAGDECAASWNPLLFADTRPATINDVLRWDSGDGEDLYAAGEDFGSFDLLARWNGISWEPVGEADAPSSSTTSYVLASFDDGNGSSLYIGGDFASKSGIVVNNIARWDGDAWHSLETVEGVGVDGVVTAMEVFDDGSGAALFVGGDFSIPGITGRYGVAKWDGIGWTPIGEIPCCFGLEDTEFEVYDDGTGPALYITGPFAQLNGVTFNGVARWDGTSLEPLVHAWGTGIGGTADMAVYDDGDGPELYFCGEFWVTTSNLGERYGFAKWDGQNMLGIPVSFGQFIFPMSIGVVPDPVDGKETLVVASSGTPDTIVTNDIPIRLRTLRDGVWTVNSVLGSDYAVYGFPSEVSWITRDDDILLFTSGDFDLFPDAALQRDATEFAGLGDRWEEIGNTLVDGAVNVAAEHDDGTGPRLVIGGSFSSAGGRLARGLAAWNGYNWEPLEIIGDDGLNGVVYALHSFDDGSGPALYIGGDFSESLNGMELNNIAKLTSGALEPLVDRFGLVGFDGPVFTLEVFDDGNGERLYAGGDFLNFGFTTSRRLARLEDGAFVDPPGVNPEGAIYELRTIEFGAESSLYACGVFGLVGARDINGVAAYDGAIWSGLASNGVDGVDGTVRAIERGTIAGVPTLFVGGDFANAGGLPTGPVAAWNGQSWFTLGADSVLSAGAVVTDLTVFGNENSLYVSSISGEADSTWLTRFADGIWEQEEPYSVNSPSTNNPRGAQLLKAVEVAGRPTLLVGMRDLGQRLLGFPGCDAAPCPADLEPDGILDLNDIVAFVTGFTTLDPIADLADPVGTFDLADIVAFVTAFNAGCP